MGYKQSITTILSGVYTSKYLDTVPEPQKTIPTVVCHTRKLQLHSLLTLYHCYVTNVDAHLSHLYVYISARKEFWNLFIIIGLNTDGTKKSIMSGTFTMT